MTTDPALGGRWTSLRAAGRDWLWHRPDPARSRGRPGDSFVDAGGVEECLRPSGDRTGDPATAGDSGLCEWRPTVGTS
ncbi:hypothetical protein [Actinoplanes sp. NBRC 103695]|uniref:hypothetical protein n=1 Tax=Actinoplanes sp. NBRC 103695 TaxID=3032202 RepID=UPI0025544787|nr:hypothetical protein [Actinoplanes sp. NBRC 103695]